MPDDETVEKKVSAAGIAAVVGALAAGGGGVGLLAGGAETTRDLAALQDENKEIRKLMAEEEARMVALATKTDADAAARSRRVREGLEVLIGELEDKVHTMELQLARQGRGDP